MRLLRPLLICLLLPGLSVAASVEMPEWNEASESTGYALGGGLWPAGLLPDSKATEEEASGEVADADSATASEAGESIEPSPTKFYGPVLGPEDENAVAETGAEPGAEGAPEVIGTTLATEGVNPEGTEEPVALEVEPLPPLEGELKEHYFAYAPVEYLIDPQRLLTEQKSNDIKRFLEFHSDESNFHIYVMVIGETQTIPEDIDLHAKHKEWFSDSPTVLMLYYREQPDMTELVYNDSVRSTLPEQVFDRIRDNCLREGSVTDDAPDQVEKMAIELSIQLYWLGRLMEAEGKGEKEMVASAAVHEMPASADAPELLREYVPGIFVEESGQWVPYVVTALLVLAGVCLFGFVAWLVLWWRSRESVSGKPLIFPDFRFAPRLGGEYSGGGFVGMSFEIGDHTSH